MTHIHEEIDWPTMRWSDATLASLLAEVRHKQGRLLGKMEGLGFGLQAEASLTTITSDVVNSSAIEGELLNSEKVRSSIARRLGMNIGGVAAASRDVEGIVEMMLNATQHFAQPLTAERLCSWHSCLFPTGQSGIRKITVGAWRPLSAGAMQVVSGPLGTEKVHFEAPTAEKLGIEMQRFLAWFDSAGPMDPVLKAALAHFWFVTIHPFEDGNGRIGRAIADLALARADGTAQRFYSMSAQIEAERKDYYLALERTQRGHLDVTSWMAWFLGCLGRSIDKAQENLATLLHKAKLWEKLNQRPVNARQGKVINRLFEDFEGKLTSSKYAKLAKCSDDTALRDIRALVEWGILIQNEGGGRSTSYRFVG